MKTLKKNPLVQRMEDMNIPGSAIWFGVDQNKKPIIGTVLYQKFLKKEKTPVIRGRIKTYNKMEDTVNSNGKFKQNCKHKNFTFLRHIYGRKDAKGSVMCMLRLCQSCGQMQKANLRYVDCTPYQAVRMGYQIRDERFVTVVTKGSPESKVTNYILA